MFLHDLWCRATGQETVEDRIWRKMVEKHPEIEHLVLPVMDPPESERRAMEPSHSGRRWRGRWLPGRRLLDVLRRWP